MGEGEEERSGAPRERSIFVSATEAPPLLRRERSSIVGVSPCRDQQFCDQRFCDQRFRDQRFHVQRFRDQCFRVQRFRGQCFGDPRCSAGRLLPRWRRPGRLLPAAATPGCIRSGEHGVDRSEKPVALQALRLAPIIPQ